jgi:hypothetical protein
MSCAVLPWVEVAAIGRLIKQVDSFVRDAAGRINFRRPDEIERRNIWGVELLQPFLVHGADGEFVFGMPAGGFLSRRTRQKSQEPIAWSREISFSMFALGAAQGIWGQPANTNFHLNQF